MRVGFDSDGCLDNFHAGVKATLEYKGLGYLWKSGPNSKSYWNYFQDWGWTFAQFKELCDFGVDHGLIFTGHFFEGAVDTVNRLAKQGHEIIIITDRAFGSDPMNSQRNTIEAYRNAGIWYDEIHFTADKTSVEVDCMVEDKWENFVALQNAGVPTKLITREWNEDYGPHPDRINHVSEYADWVINVSNQGFIDIPISLT